MAKIPGRVLLDRSVILHYRPYRESSLLIDVLTEHHGRIRVLGRGVRRGKHPLSRILRPLHCVRLSWSGLGELPLLTDAESLGSEPMLVGQALFCGFYVSELVMALLPLQDACPGLFAIFLETIGRLQNDVDLQEVLRSFEVSLLQEIGYGLQFESDASGSPIRPDRNYLYDLEKGPVLMTEASANTLKGSTLEALSRGQFRDNEQAREAKRLMRMVIQYHLNGRPLKSRELFKQLPSGSYP